MSRPAARLLWIVLALALAGCARAQLPARLEITYEVLRNGSRIAEITASLEQGAGRYRLTETWRGKGIYVLLGKATRKSAGMLPGEGPRPEEFTDERSGRDTARAWFQWGANTLTMRYKGKSRSEPIPPDAQDRLSFILALALAPAGTKAMEFHLIDGRGVSRQAYEFAGRERVRTAAGEFEALRVVRGKEDGRVELWLAAVLGNLPVRMLAVENNGTRYEQLATHISGL